MKPAFTLSCLMAFVDFYFNFPRLKTHRPIKQHVKCCLAFTIVISLMLFLPLTSPAQAKTFTVNITGDEADPDAGEFGDDGECDVDPVTGGNQCTFRAAIQNHNGNRHLGQNEIKFNIPNAAGAGSIVLKIGSGGSGALPNVLGSVIIKATNEPDGRRIEIDGSQAGGGAIGLSLLGSGCQISDFIINSFSSHGIFISGTPPPGGGGHIIRGNYIGTDSSGKVSKGNGGDGIYIDNTPDDSIGGDKLEDMNIISGNKGYGIVIHGADPLVDFQPNGARNIVIAGNFIGLDADGNLVLPNEKGGVLNENAPNNRIGADSTGRGNKIAGVKNGITVHGNLSEGVGILGNFIGKDGTGLKFSAGIFTRSGKALSIKGNFLTNIDSVGMDIYLDANGDYDIRHNKLNGTVKAGTKFTFGPGRVIDVNYQNNLHRSNGTGLVIDESLNSTINWLVTGDTAINGGIGGNVIFRANGKKHFDGNRWEANAGIGLKYAFDLAPGVNAMFILDGNVAARNRGAGFEGDVKLSAQSVFTYSMYNLRGSSNSRDGYKLALRATAGASSTVTFAGESEFSVNGGFGLAITGDKAVLDIAKFSFEKSSARENVDGAFYLFDVKFPFSITGNEITGNKGPGITLDGEAFAHIDSNRISGNESAVLLKNLATARINNNVVNANGKGILLTGTGTGILISENSIFNNVEPGIDVVGTVPQNHPVLKTLTSSGGNTTITGSLNSSPNKTYRIEFFSNSRCHPAGFGEGEKFIGSASVLTDASGNVNFSSSLTGVTIPPGFVVTSTAIDPDNNTSEFSNCVGAAGNIPTTDLSVTKSADKAVVSAGGQVAFTITLVNNGPVQATQILVTDSLPAALRFNQAFASAGVYNNITRKWTVPSLESGAQATLVLAATTSEIGEFTNLVRILSADQPDHNQANNEDTASIMVNPKTTIAMINDLMTQVQDFEKSGLMRKFPAADLMTTLRTAITQINLSNPGGAINQLLTFIKIVNYMVQIGYVSASNAMLLTNAAQEIIQQLQQPQPLTGKNARSSDYLSENLKDRIRKASLDIYPNPFRDAVLVEVNLASEGMAALDIYNAHGQRVEVIVQQALPGGTHIFRWQPKRLPAGMYFIRLTAQGRVETKQVVFLK